MKILFLFISHKLTDNQIYEAKNRLEIEKFVYLPEKLQKKWSNIPPDLNTLKEYLIPFKKFLKANSSKGDYIFIQGDPGAVFSLVQFVKSIGLIPVYSTTNRKAKEINNGNKIRVYRVFEHIQFRQYENFKDVID